MEAGFGIMALIRTHTGRLVDPLALDPALVVIDDVAFALSNINRYAGHSRLSVAQHCCLVSDQLRMDGHDRQIQFDGLMHDSVEAFGLMDIPSPLKHLPQMAFYREAEQYTGMVLSEVFGFSWPEPGAVKAMDIRMRLTEQRDLFRRKPHTDDTALPLRQNIRLWTAERAQHGFLQRFENLRKVDSL
jgi:hypothetical protein